MTDEINNSEMTPAQARMAKARAARTQHMADRKRLEKLSREYEKANRPTPEQIDEAYANAPEPIVRHAKKAPIVPDEPAAARTQTRSSARSTTDGRIEVTGRNGEVLSRTRTTVGDIFDIPQSMIPPGWSYQWNAVSVAGNKDILLDQTHMMHQNGWRPVPAERYAGTLVPRESKGPIIRGQQMLMERPMALTLEAQAEDERNARQLISDRNESLKLAGVKKDLGEGFEMGDKYRGANAGARIQIDKSMDVLNVNRQAGNYTTFEE
jgi:hypothetical protein